MDDLLKHSASDTRPSIVLASSSPRRQELLQTLHIKFRVHPSDVSEEVDGPVSPGQFVEILAHRKAREVAPLFADSPVPYYVIGSDTVVVVDDEILGKPKDKQDAFRMLSLLQGRQHQVYTGLCVMNAQSDEMRLGHSKTEVFMTELSTSHIDDYIRTGEPMGKAGSYAIQGIGGTLVRRIEGDFFTVVGLPLWLLRDYLDSFGMSLDDFRNDSPS